MSVKDIIKDNILERFAGGTGLSFWEIMLILAVSCIVGIYIFLVYKNFSKSEFYSRDLNITMAGMTVVTAAIMIAMQSNLLVSLGMVGALSIVRFRTAIKSPIDLLYLFWAISEGIICGVGLYVLGAVLCIIMTILIFVLGKIPNSKAPQLLVVRMSMDVDAKKVFENVDKMSRYSKEKSSIIKNNEREVIYEIMTVDGDALTNAIYHMKGILSINLLEHHGEVRT